MRNASRQNLCYGTSTNPAKLSPNQKKELKDEGKNHEQKISAGPILSFVIRTLLIFNDTPLQEKEGHNYAGSPFADN